MIDYNEMAVLENELNRFKPSTRLPVLILTLLVCGIYACEQRVVSPFFLASEINSNPDYPVAPVLILSGNETVESDSCRIETAQADSVIFVDISVGPVNPEQLDNKYIKILLDVSVGLKETGLVVSDTSGVLLPGPGNYPLVLRVENSRALSAGENRVAVVAITRYLDPYGYLALPMGRRLRYCTILWQ